IGVDDCLSKGSRPGEWVRVYARVVPGVRDRERRRRRPVFEQLQPGPEGRPRGAPAGRDVLGLGMLFPGVEQWHEHFLSRTATARKLLGRVTTTARTMCASGWPDSKTDHS